MSWCKLEVELQSAKSITNPDPTSDLATRQPPPLTVVALSLRLHIDPTTQTSEVLAASVVHLAGVSMETPMAREEWNSPGMLGNFSVVRKLDGRPWPTGGWFGCCRALCQLVLLSHALLVQILLM